MSRDYLVFTFSATPGAMGELAGHERRSSWSWPGRSAVLGLCAAALGIRREGDFSAIDRLGMAVGVYSSGTPGATFIPSRACLLLPSAILNRAAMR